MIFISNSTASTSYGTIAIKPNHDYVVEEAARITRTATLDGGAYIYHGGARNADLQFNITTRLSEADAEIMRYLYQDCTSIIISTKEGCFSGAISTFSNIGGRVVVKVLSSGDLE